MGCTPSTQLHDDDYSVGDSSSDEDTAGSTARSPRSSQRDVRHWRKVDLECRALSRPLGPPVSESDEETTRPGDRRVSFCVEIKILRRVRAESPRRPPRHLHDTCSTA